jgi:hypothetical protein
MADPNIDFADFLDRYQDHTPTSFDRHICSELDGFFMGPCSLNRDSGILQTVNFGIAAELIMKSSNHEETAVHRFGHWACGWYEILLIHPDDIEALKVAASLASSLADYPSLDDEAFSEAEFEAASVAWEGMRISDRIEACSRYRVSIFAARRDTIPESPTGELVSYLAE